MRILFLALDIDFSNRRGDAVHVRELVRALSNMGDHVDLVTATPHRETADLGPGTTHHIRPSFRDPRLVRALARIADETEAEVVYERRFSPKVAFGVSWLTGLPFVVEVNGVEEEAEIQGRRVSGPFKRFARGIMFRRASRVVSVTEGLGQHVRKRYRLTADRVAVVPNGVDADQFAPHGGPAEPAVLPPGQWVVFVGNLAPWQGVDTLLAATPLIASQIPSVRVAIVGDGMLRDSLESRARQLGIADRTTFVGAVPHSEVPGYLWAAAVCVAPFTRKRNEAIGLSPLKVYEYMAAAKPVVASAVSGVREVLRDSVAGVLVPPDDPSALAAAVSEVLSNPSGGSEMGTRGRVYAVAHCSWAATARGVHQVLQQAIGA